MFCPTCGKEFPNETNVCPSCGTCVNWETVVVPEPEPVVEPEVVVEPEPAVEPEVVSSPEVEAIKAAWAANEAKKQDAPAPKPKLSKSAQWSLVLGAISVLIGVVSVVCSLLVDGAAGAVLGIWLFILGLLVVEGACVPCTIALVNGIRRKQRSWRRCAIWGFVMIAVAVILLFVGYFLCVFGTITDSIINHVGFHFSL